MPNGKLQEIRISALRHEGLSRNDLALRAKVLMCPKTFATLWMLQDHNVTKPLPSDPTNDLYTRSQSKLQMVIGLDLLESHPVRTATFLDDHGTVQVRYCSFSGRYIALGNRTFPLTSRALRSIVKRLDSMGDFFCT